MDGSTRTPVHLWVVGAFATLWNAYGVYDYLMTQMRNAAHLAQFTPAQRAYFESMPAWLDAAWAFGVWGGLAGSLLLLARSRHAVTAFGVSLAGLAASTAYQYIVATVPPGVETGTMVVLHLVVWAGAIAFLVYALRMRKRGVLR